jgi:hypothetical protein
MEGKGKGNAGVYISIRKQYLFPPPPSENEIFSPSRDMSFFDFHHGLFALILPNFASILPFYFPFSHFLSPFFLFFSLSSFFIYIFLLFLFTFSYFFPQMTSADIPPPRGGIFQYIDPWGNVKVRVRVRGGEGMRSGREKGENLEGKGREREGKERYRKR